MTSPVDRFIWSETASKAAVLGALDILARYNIGLRLAVLPGDVADAVHIIGAAQEKGVHIGCWPMLENSEGRWLSVWTATAFKKYCAMLTAKFASAGTMPDEWILDLEPPIWWWRKDISRPVPHFRGHPTDISNLVFDLKSTGAKVVATAFPMTIARRGSLGWQQIVGTPVANIPFDKINVMVYTSILTGYSRGALRPEDSESLLRLACETVRKTLGSKGEVSVGAVSTGALGDEPVYRDVSDLRRDMAIVKSSGVESLALFSLRGVLERTPKDWLDTFCAAPSDANEAENASSEQPLSPITPRARALWTMSQGMGWVAEKTSAFRNHFRR